ncbi:hypothetical protein BDZ91DRAFT_799984 [Kalaharituber pfeilii]|nr:hypothetical protein BDZ91DRAFT_799984 [Kalaharituber pfeilii]
MSAPTTAFSSIPRTPFLGRYTTVLIDLLRVNAGENVVLCDYALLAKPDAHLEEDGLVHPRTGSVDHYSIQTAKPVKLKGTCHATSHSPPSYHLRCLPTSMTSSPTTTMTRAPSTSTSLSPTP